MRCACPPNLGSSLASAVSAYSRTAAEAEGRCGREGASEGGGRTVGGGHHMQKVEVTGAAVVRCA